MNMRNATCVGTETSKVPTRVTLLFIFYSVVLQESAHKLAASIFIQSEGSKVYFNEMQELAASLQVGFGKSGKEP